MAVDQDLFTAERRRVLGKKVKRLRREGILPANIYSRGMPSIAVQLPERVARELLIAHGTDTLLQLRLEGEDQPRPVVVRSVQRHVLSRAIQHIDFWQVDLQRTMQANVPVHIVGEAPAVHVYQGVVLHEADTVAVEALPASMPEFIEVSIDGLEELDAQITVADLRLPAGITVLTDPAVTIARVARPRVVAEEEEELPEGEQAVLAAEGEEAPAEAEDEER